MRTRVALWAAVMVGGCTDLGSPLQPDAPAIPDADQEGDAGAGEQAAPADASPAPTGIVHGISMRDMLFVAETGGPIPPLRVRAGDTIRWRNDEPSYVRHAVQDGEVAGAIIPKPRLFQSSLLDPGQAFDWIVSAPPGRFFYLCVTHPSTMKNGEVWVE